MAHKEQLEAFMQEVRAPNVSHERVMEIYTEWADSYDKGMNAPENLGPHKVARMVPEVLGERKEARILDLGAGTGLCAEEMFQSQFEDCSHWECHTCMFGAIWQSLRQELLKFGFSNIDALDGSAAMLDVARKKGVYKNLICDLLGSNKLKIEDGTYDIATIVGSLVPGHVNGSCLGEVARIIKPGGYFVGAVATKHLTTCDDLKDLEPAMQRMENDGVWKRIVRRVELYYKSEDAVFFVFQVLPK